MMLGVVGLTVSNRIPYGNAGRARVFMEGDLPVVAFTPAPHGGPEVMWFCFRLTETDTPTAQKVRITLQNFGNLLGAGSPSALYPVYQPQGQAWYRMKAGAPTSLPDGRMDISWTIPYPTPSTDVALCFPYGKPELKNLLGKSKGYWKQDEIGMSQSGRPLIRLANDYGSPGGRRHGLYLVARQHAGETPGSWAMHGLLEYISRGRRDQFVVWAVPLADMDGVLHGDYGKDNYPYDLNRAWGTPPMRHETLVYQRDIARWRERCQPVLAIDFHSPGACATEGVYVYLPSPDNFPDAHRAAQKWANVIKQELGTEYAADDFARVATYASRWNTPTFTAHAASALDLPALSLEIPYCKVGTTVLTQKHYREIGKRIARALTIKGA